jgi:hypothetical protein
VALTGIRWMVSLVVAVAATTSGGLADARGHERRFLGSTPAGPLAVVRGDAIRTPDRRACRSWGKLGSEWHELDALGRVVGRSRVAAKEFYEYSGCDELTLRHVAGQKGVGLYVDPRADYKAPLAARWTPGPAAMADLERIANARQSKVENLDGRVIPLRTRGFFFTFGATKGGTRDRAAKHYAVIGGVSLVVAELRGGRWVVIYENLPPKNRAIGSGYEVLAVTDMNADGRPEVFVHEKEEHGEWYGDATFIEGADGTWTRVGPGIFGSTA